MLGVKRDMCDSTYSHTHSHTQISGLAEVEVSDAHNHNNIREELWRGETFVGGGRMKVGVRQEGYKQ